MKKPKRDPICPATHEHCCDYEKRIVTLTKEVERLSEKVVVMECQAHPCTSALSEKIGRLVIKEAEAEEEIQSLRTQCAEAGTIIRQVWYEGITAGNLKKSIEFYLYREDARRGKDKT